MFPHLRQHRSHCVPKRMPAHAGDADFVESRPDLPLQNRSQIEWLLSLATMRRKDEIPWLLKPAVAVGNSTSVGWLWNIALR